MAVLPYDTAIQKHLRPGEQLRWVGRARQGWRYRWSNRLVIVQTAAAVLSLIWLFRFAIWAMSELGFEDIEDAQEFYKQIMRRGRPDGSSTESWHDMRMNEENSATS